jgi:hypothetical protein
MEALYKKGNLRNCYIAEWKRVGVKTCRKYVFRDIFKNYLQIEWLYPDFICTFAFG